MIVTLLKSRRELLERIQPGSDGAEVGVFAGDFSAEILATPVKSLHLIDCWRHQGGDYDTCPCNPNDEEHQKNYQRVLERFAHQIVERRVKVIRGMSVAVSNLFEAGSLDWVYLDADHSYEAVTADLMAWHKKLKPGGWLCGHDYTERPEARAMNFGVKLAVDDFCRREGWEMLYLTDESWPSYCLVKL